MNQDIRFDLNARVEVFVTADDLTSHASYDGIVKGGGTEDDRIAALRSLAAQIAFEAVETRNRAKDGNEVEITADVSPSDINLDRIDWSSLATPEELSP